MTIDLLELGASVLGDLVDEVVFVGGATITLWITDPAVPPPRPTKDVDVIVEVATRADYYAFEERLRPWVSRTTARLSAAGSIARAAWFSMRCQPTPRCWGFEKSMAA